ncbi:zinc/iron-chelating domain-containing protein [Chromatium okenii]|uniref:YkgJ family cysteine cluster protein n=1 Tax=Chromatium okenii TaxID=61644 RepID=UPI00190704EE|nr:YkgJ family cysteine cluster protein [Chromatium okenii]MBK1642818.1 zinc/iron-chelating domain-containing protein [Chromatium okenii]
MKAQRPATAPASEQHFACTGCGKCCHGWLPLTVADAFANAGRFPLALVWTPVPEVSRAFDLTAQLGTVVQIAKRKRVAVLIAPTAYLPPSFPCPALSPDNRCAIQAEKPLRCRTMPFYPYRRASDQADVLLPRKGWQCDISTTAPLVYQQRKIVDRSDFDAERAALVAQAPMLRTYADTTLKHYPTVLAQLLKAAQNPAAGRFIVGFASLLRWHKAFDPVTFAQAQHPLLCAFAERTAAAPTLAIYHRYYQEAAAELAWFTNADPP